MPRRHDLFLISDEVYREIVYGGRKVSTMLEYADAAENVIVIDTVSKRFSACGARVGILVSRNRELMAQALKICQGRLCAATLDQLGAAAPVRRSSDYFSARAGGVPQAAGYLHGGPISDPRRGVRVPQGRFLPHGQAAGG